MTTDTATKAATIVIPGRPGEIDEKFAAFVGRKFDDLTDDQRDTVDDGLDEGQLYFAELDAAAKTIKTDIALSPIIIKIPDATEDDLIKAVVATASALLGSFL